MRVGFIGLGSMGLPMTRLLLAAGHEVAVASRSRPPVDRAVSAGAIDGGDPAGVAGRSDGTILCVPFSPDVRAVIDQLLPALGPGKIVVDCATIEPSAELEFHQRVAATGADYLEAPLSGGPEAARAGTLAVVVGGEAAVLERARPALQPFARKIVHMGGPGTGQSAKLCNNLIHAAQNLAVGEACALALRAGLNISAFREAVLHSTGDCTAVRNRIPVPGIVPNSPASNDWKGFATDMMIKEMDMVLDFAATQGVPVISTALYRSLLVLASAAGYGGEDFSALGKVFQDPVRHRGAHEWLAQAIRLMSKTRQKTDGLEYGGSSQD